MEPIITVGENRKTMTDYMHETAAAKHYLDQRIEGMLKAVIAPISRQDHTYGMRAARGELFGAPPTVRFRDQELGRDITDKLGGSLYDSGSGKRAVSASYSGLVGKTASAGYAATSGAASAGYSAGSLSFSTSYGNSSGGAGYTGENQSGYMSGLSVNY